MLMPGARARQPRPGERVRNWQRSASDHAAPVSFSGAVAGAVALPPRLC